MHHQSANEENDLKREHDEGGSVFRGDSQFIRHRYEQFLHCLIRGGSIKSAAAAVNISYRTAIRWMHTPVLQELYEEISAGLAEYERDRTVKAATLAMDVLVHILSREEGIVGGNEGGTSNAIRAAKVILEHASRDEEVKLLRAQVHELQRITSIEQAQLPPARTIVSESKEDCPTMSLSDTQKKPVWLSEIQPEANMEEMGSGETAPDESDKHLAARWKAHEDEIRCWQANPFDYPWAAGD